MSALTKDFDDWRGVQRLPRIKRGDFVGLRIAFWDLECTGLEARADTILCSCICDSFGQVTTHRIDKYRRKNALDDLALAVDVRDELNKYDMVVTWNGSGFDWPFLNARLLVAKKELPRSDLMHLDLMWKAGGRSRWSVRAGRRSLGNISEFFSVKETGRSKTTTQWDDWTLARTGDRPALLRIIEHCEADTRVLRDVYAYLKPLVVSVHR